MNITNVDRSLPMQLVSRAFELKIAPRARSVEEVIEDIVNLDGSVNVIVWYEGPFGMPITGAQFMKDKILEPLLTRKPDAKAIIYSLRGWNFTDPTASVLAGAVNRINKSAVECIDASEYFSYCARMPSNLKEFLSAELPKKQWLKKISKGRKPSGVSVDKFFKINTVFDYMKQTDMTAAYSEVQYVEGYFLIREHVQRALSNRQEKVQVVFLLPNDEGKYYRDFPKEIERMLRIDFGLSLDSLQILISFQFFKYGQRNSRPYLDGTAEIMQAKDVENYFDFIGRLA